MLIRLNKENSTINDALASIAVKKDYKKIDFDFISSDGFKSRFVVFNGDTVVGKITIINNKYGALCFFNERTTKKIR